MDSIPEVARESNAHMYMCVLSLCALNSANDKNSRVHHEHMYSLSRLSSHNKKSQQGNHRIPHSNHRSTTVRSREHSLKASIDTWYNIPRMNNPEGDLNIQILYAVACVSLWLTFRELSSELLSKSKTSPVLDLWLLRI